MSLSTEAASVAADAVLALCDGGRLRIFGTTKLLADLPLPGFNLAVDGSATAHTIPPAYAKQTGTAEFFEVIAPDGETVFDGTVGTKNSGADLILNKVKIAAGARVTVVAFTYTQQRG